MPVLPNDPGTPAEGQSSGRWTNGRAPHQGPDGPSQDSCPFSPPIYFSHPPAQHVSGTLSLVDRNKACPEGGGDP